MNFSLLLNRYLGALSKHKKQLYETFKFNIDDLKQIKKSVNICKKEKKISYDFTNITLIIPKKLKPNHSIPRLLEDIKITLKLDGEVTLNLYDKLNVVDPIINMETLDLILESGKYTSSWHLDRHVPVEGENQSDILHPRYHLTFGGKYMESLDVRDEDVFGQSLIVRSPRIFHPPMEVILGLDFIFKHFVPASKLELLQDESYISVIEEMKRFIWKPYALAFVKGFCDYIDLDRESYEFDEKFVKSVVGHYN